MKKYVFDRYKSGSADEYIEIFDDERTALKNAKNKWDYETSKMEKERYKREDGLFHVFEIEISEEELIAYENGDGLPLDEHWTRDVWNAKHNEVILIELCNNGCSQRYALTPKEFQETFVERLETGMPKSQDEWQTYELRPMVHLWYCNATVGDELWNTFFTDMEYGLSEGDIESGNLATVEHSEMKLLSPYVPVKTGHDSPVYYTVQAADSGSMEKKRLFVDMDGTLAVFTPVDELETLYQKGYFFNQAPQENVVAAVKQIVSKNPEIEVNILSAYLSDSTYALEEKNQWLDQYLPEIDQAHRIFLPCGKDKKDYIPGGIRESDILLDDYTKNLNDWQPPARGIKLLNDINHTRGSWQHDRIRYDRNPDELATAIMDIIDGKRRIFDISTQKTQPSIKRTASRKAASTPHMTETLEK